MGGLGETLLVRRIEPAAANLAGQNFLAEADTDRLLLVVDPLLDLVARSGGPHMAEPVPARLGRGAGQNFHGITALELAVQRRNTAVDLSSLALETDLSVHMESEIDRRRALGEPLHVALRSEDEDLVLIE